MAEQTLAFTEVKRFNDRELNKLRKETYDEIYMQMLTNFCVTVEKAERLEDIYREIIPCCQRITTADGIDVFVAKIKRHLICTEPQLYRIMKEHYAAFDECYKDVTSLGGEVFKNLSFINWADQKNLPEKVTSFRVPRMRKGSTLFYVAS